MNAFESVKGYLHPDVSDRLSQLIADHDVRSVIEIGSFVGKSAVFFAERVESVICLDPFGLELSPPGTMAHKRWVYEQAGWTTQYDMFLANTLPFSNIRHIKLPAQEALRQNLEADLVYVDGSHYYDDVVADIEGWRPRTRKVLCGDDNLNARFGVTQAVMDCGIQHRSERLWWEIRGT
jgi:cephalosporin hydroxylase